MNAYSDRQHARDREYAEAWAKLTPRQRKQMAKAGIEGPALPVYQTGKHDQEEFVERCAAEAEQEEDALPVGPSPELAHVARRVIGELLAQDNIRLTTECLAIVTGLSYDGNSMSETAKRHGVTRAAVSKRCIEIADALGLPPTRAMRRLTARVRYERRARNCHSRNDH